jgi:hypothetical protein
MIELRLRGALVAITRIEISIRALRSSLRSELLFTRLLLRSLLARSPKIALRVEATRSASLLWLTSIWLEIAAVGWTLLGVARLEIAAVGWTLLGVARLEIVAVGWTLLGVARLEIAAVGWTLLGVARLEIAAVGWTLLGVARLEIAAVGWTLLAITHGSAATRSVAGSWTRCRRSHCIELTIAAGVAFVVNIGRPLADGLVLRKVHVNSFEEGLLFAGVKIAPETNADPIDAEGTNAHTGQLFNRNACVIHDPPNNVIHPLVQRNREENSITGFAQHAELVGNNLLAFNRNATSDPLEHARVRALRGEDVIFLFKPIAWMHDAVRQLTIIGQEEQALSFPIKSADRVEAFFGVDEIHDGASTAFVAGRGDVAARLVEHHVAAFLRPDD